MQPFFYAKVFLICLNFYFSVMKTNVLGVLSVSQIVAKHMIKRGAQGSIVNVSSAASSRALNLHTSYCASKAALDSLTRSMALELGPHKVRTYLLVTGERLYEWPMKNMERISGRD